MNSVCLPTYNHMPELGAEPDIARDVAAAASAGFRLVGLDLGGVRHFTRGGRTPEDLRALLESHRLRCHEVAAVYAGPDLARARGDLAEAVATVAALEPEYLIFGVDAQPGDAALFLQEAATSLAEIGTALAIEFLPTMVVDSINSARDILAAVGDPRARILLDSWHFFRGPSTWADLADLPVEEIGLVHFDDALPLAGGDLLHETRHRRVMPGEGEFDLPRFCDLLRRKGYGGVVSLEVLSEAWRTSDSEMFARRAMEALTAYWS